MNDIIKIINEQTNVLFINMYEQRIRELINTTSKDADEMTPVNVEEMTSDKTE